VLMGDKVRLRAVQESDLPILHAELYDDVATRTAADARPWRPISASSATPYAVNDADTSAARFGVVELASDDLAGEGLLWGIDMHNRCAHIGISLRPTFRGRGLSGDVVRVLCEYGFVVRGFNRLQIETLATNVAMIRAAEQVGFVQEGRLHKNAWVMGAFVDEIVLGLLAQDWRSRT
jgi:RimJ/RimL family protein N-acetyltransferase